MPSSRQFTKRLRKQSEAMAKCSDAEIPSRLFDEANCRFAGSALIPQPSWKQDEA